MKNLFTELFGEFLGTFILVFIGCGTVGLAILFNTFESLLEVAIVWGIGVSLAIYLTRTFCPAHLNPAVSVAMTFAGKLKVTQLPLFVFSQLAGAMAAGELLYALLAKDIVTYELTNGIIRGSESSVNTAMMFGEFFPNPGYADTIHASQFKASIFEGVGTAALLLVIFLIIWGGEKLSKIAPLLIGSTVTLIICIVAPYTQAGLNPARDFGPRLIAYFAGWGDAAFPAPSYSFFTVYILSPSIGGAFIGLLSRTLKKAEK